MEAYRAYLIESSSETLHWLGKARNSVSTYLGESKKQRFDILISEAATLVLECLSAQKQS